MFPLPEQLIRLQTPDDLSIEIIQFSVKIKVYSCSQWLFPNPPPRQSLAVKFKIMHNIT